MVRHLWVIAGFIIGITEWVNADTIVLPNDPCFSYMGRWDRTSENVAITVNTGSAVRFGFTGDRCTLLFRTSLYTTYPHPSLWYRIDAGEWVEREIESELLLTPADLSLSSHMVEIVVKGLILKYHRWSSTLAAAVYFSGISLPEGAFFLPGRAPTGPRIEILGDSITEGIAAVGVSGPESYTTDGRRTYGYLLGEAFDADLRLVGFSGTGITAWGNGATPPVLRTFPYFHGTVEKDEWQADFVIINLGTNDRDVSVTSFMNGYTELLTMIRASYPAAMIFCLRPFNGQHAARIRDVVETVRASGDVFVEYVDTEGWIQTYADTTDGIHPNLEGHRKIAGFLVDMIMPLVTSDLKLYHLY